MYYFIELAGSITNIALLSLFMSRLFVRNKIQSKWHYTFLTLLCTGQCVLSLFPNWVIACLTEGEITNVLPHKELNKICS